MDVWNEHYMVADLIAPLRTTQWSFIWFVPKYSYQHHNVYRLKWYYSV